MSSQWIRRLPALASIVAGLSVGGGGTAAAQEPTETPVDAVVAEDAAANCTVAQQGTGAREDFVGTSESDLIFGGSGGDTLKGLASTDCLKGGPGADVVVGGIGVDRLKGGSGRDKIVARDGRRDRVRCGPQRDVARVDHRDRVSGCELVSRASAKKGGRPGGGTTPPPDPAPDPDCQPSLSSLTAPGCDLLASDSGEVANVESLWGNIECAADSRHSMFSTGGDTYPSATGVGQDDGGYRQLTVQDGDDFYGERCELGRNEHRYDSPSQEGTFQVYREGQHRLTFLSLRLEEGFPLGTPHWQTVIQMKQAQPSAGGGGGPILEVQASGNRFRLVHDWDELWSVPATVGGWTRFAFDVTYSQDPRLGSLQLYVDANGDGDAADQGEQSPVFRVNTLKTEVGGGWSGDGIAPGEAIPSHLRTGIYHDPAIGCPSSGCSIAVDNVEVLRGD